MTIVCLSFLTMLLPQALHLKVRIGTGNNKQYTVCHIYGGRRNMQILNSCLPIGHQIHDGFSISASKGFGKTLLQTQQCGERFYSKH